MPSLVLIADHDPVQRRLLEAMVRRFGYDAECVDSGATALARLAALGERPVDVLVLDLFLPDLDGAAALSDMRERRIDVPTIVETQAGQIELVMAAMRAGAHDFVVKPVGAERMLVSLKNALRFRALQDEARRARRRGAGALGFRHVFTQSEDMARAIRLGERAARAHLPVLIEGEPGVGKHLFARAIQGASDRRGRPLVAVNCAALAPEMAEALLFGPEGRFSEAHGGTLFLDEIGRLAPPLQARLLRLLQDGELDPAPGRRAARVDVRLISATSQNLIEQVKAGLFREDLYYRLNVFPVALPPLRARAGDIAGLAQRFAQRFAAEEGKNIRGLSAEALHLLARYEWPGNVRQLENALFRAVVLCEGDELGVAEFPQIAARVSGYEVRVPPAPAFAAPLRAFAEPARGDLRDPHALRLLDEDGHVRRLEAVEGELIRFALGHYRGQMSEMARRLGIGRSTLYRKLKDLGLHQPDEDIAEEGAPARFDAAEFKPGGRAAA
jgi:DNA-binding NtrC family response regulator